MHDDESGIIDPPPQTMKLSDFEIGMQFECGGNAFLCTDKGTRVVVAVEVKDDWMAGPPYALGEIVFDEDDITGCTPITD